MAGSRVGITKPVDIELNDGRTFGIIERSDGSLFVGAGFPAKERTSEYLGFDKEPGDIEFINAFIDIDGPVAFNQRPYYARWWPEGDENKSCARTDVNIWALYPGTEAGIGKYILFYKELVKKGAIPLDMQMRLSPFYKRCKDILMMG